jgi:hypothetical protein
VLGTSVQTVTRRYARLRAEAGLRVVALLDPAATGQKQWLVRLTAATGTAQHARHAQKDLPVTMPGVSKQDPVSRAVSSPPRRSIGGNVIA